MKRLRFSTSFRRILISIRYLVVVAIILWIASRQIVETGKSAVLSLHYFLKNPSVSYDQKMKRRLGTNYLLFKFARENTPPSATIAIPPWVRPWMNAGNWALMQYFLYPRKSRSASPTAPTVDKKATHVLVAWGEWWVRDRRLHGWPKFPVNIRRFYHLPITRKILVDELGISSSLPGVGSKLSQENMKHPPQLLENYISDSEKKLEHHRRIKVGDHLVEFIQIGYTLNCYDYWMKTVELPLAEKTVVKARVRSNVRHAVNLVAEVKYGNAELAIFGSAPNGQENLWEPLVITDLYEKARRYALARGLSSKKMWITRIGINAGFPREMPYLGRYGVIELERGQPGIKENADAKIYNAPHFLKMANYYRAKEEFEKAIGYYRLAEKLNPADAWTHCSLGDMHAKMGDKARAVKEYKKAISLQPNVAWFHFALGKVYKGQGRADLAKESFKKAVDSDPSSSWAERALEDLDEEERKKAEEFIRYKINPEYWQTDVGSLISIKTESDIVEKRSRLIHYIWGDKGFPVSKMPSSIEKTIKDGRYSDLDNLKIIDKIVVSMDYGLNSIIYHFHPAQSNNQVIIYHQGHGGEFIHGKGTIQFFLNKGYSVLAFSMPLLGMNNQPTVNLEGFGRLKLEKHGHLKFLDHPIKFFLEPIAVALNYATQGFPYNSIYMIGISGGGWTTTLYSAIDPRISKSYPVAGTYPIYLRSNSARDWGDYEQTLPELYRVANYLELYILGSYGDGRKQLQVINQYDPSCFSGMKYQTYEKQVTSLVSRLGKGKFGVYLDDTHREHKISEHALRIIIKDIEEK